jgi:hypothetical protein
VTLELGCRVYVVTGGLRSEEGLEVAGGSRGTVVGYAGPLVVVDVEDRETGETLSLTTAEWNVRRLALYGVEEGQRAG